MLYRIAAIGFIFACTSVAWIILAQVVSHRTHQQDTKLKAAVGQLWGTSQSQRAPLLYWTTEETVVTQTPDGQVTEHSKERRHLLPLEASRLQVDFHLEHRRKGLLWYATYQVALNATYTATNGTDRPLDLTFDLALPSSQAVYDDFALSIDDQPIAPLPLAEGHLQQPLHFAPGQSRQIRLSYQSQGLEEWWYRFGDHVEQVSDFELVMHTDFDAIDFPRESLAPTQQGAHRRWLASHLAVRPLAHGSLPRHGHARPPQPRSLGTRRDPSRAHIPLSLFLCSLRLCRGQRHRHPSNELLLHRRGLFQLSPAVGLPSRPLAHPLRLFGGCGSIRFLGHLLHAARSRPAAGLGGGGVGPIHLLGALLLHLLLRRLYRLGHYRPVHRHPFCRHAAYWSDGLVRRVCPSPATPQKSD